MASALVSKLRMTRPTVKIPSPAGKEPAGKENGTASMDAGTLHTLHGLANVSKPCNAMQYF